MINAVIFDMDGVIVDSEPLHKAVERQIFIELAMDVPLERQHAFTGTSNAIMWAQLKAEYNLPESIDHYVAIKESRYLKLVATDESISLIPGVEELLTSIKTAGIPIALASSSSLENIKIILNRFKLDSYFLAVASGEEVALSKPNPEVFLLAASRLGIAPTNCLVIEDSANGVSAAKAAGMFCIGLQEDQFNRQDLSQADFIISSLKEIPNNLNSIIPKSMR